MQIRIRSLGIAVLLAGQIAWADGADERYVRIYNLIQDADATLASGQSAAATEKYQEARRALEELGAAVPGWNEAVVQFRLKYISDRLQTLLAPLPPTPAKAEDEMPMAPSGGSATVIRTLKDQIRQLGVEKEMLQSKLREALAAQPAAVDSKEVARSEDTIKALQKELEVLKVRLIESESKPDRPVSPARFQEVVKDLSEARQKMAEQDSIISSLSLEKKALQTQILSTDQGMKFQALNEENLRLKQQLEQLKARVESVASLEVLAGQYGGLQKQLRAQQSRNEMLEAEKRILEDRAGQLEKRRVADTVEATREIEKALADARSSVQQANATISALKDSLRASQEARERLEREGAATEAQLSSVRSALATERLARINTEAAAKTAGEEFARTKRQRDDLEVQLAALSKSLSDTQERLQSIEAEGSGRRAKDLNVALVSGLRSGSASESPRVPPRGEVSGVGGGGKPIRADDNERTGESPVNLAHLAAIQMDQNRLSEAEATLRAALGKDPTNVMSLVMLGQLSLRQGNFEAALEPLSRAVQCDPQNADACNYLGVALMEKGLREPAEFALLRATRLAPDHGDAHFNLAVYYLRRRPALPGKASEHYQKALAAGHSVDVVIERDLKQGATVSGTR